MGTIHTLRGFKLAPKADVDWCEVRVDLLPRPPEPELLNGVKKPLILTVRRGDEGGGLALAEEVRAELYHEYLPLVDAVDIEARSLSALEGVVAAAKISGKLVVVSFHDFEGMPSSRRLRRIEKGARDDGADIVKVAAVTTGPRDVAVLLDFLDGAEGAASAMGMGELGRASRLLLAKAGSALNYGWLDKPQVPGQWQAEEFAALLRQA
ncbi:type I 3-dehydroquinate dehydratase [Terrimicrobium sacchariphilum]|uniref:type I 3-dehydroquinate dehydratase n=1 Tax=Terrimicrobium sacchariphilum TaxID=690879 RepID=UPI00094655FB|nr:type I 3-dehydroquinate dehydratase [Terrimicrobium sacchariphilum]